MSYQASQQRILDAEAAFAAGDQDRAKALFREAAELQRAFVDGEPAQRVRTRSVFGLSAAVLFYRASDLDDAERLARRLLAEPWIEQGSAGKLGALLKLIEDERAIGTGGAIRQRLKLLGATSVRPSRRPLFRGARP